MSCEREKLIDLLWSYCEIGGNEVESMADLLIAHGVTFATDTNVGGKWISVEDRLPEDKEIVLCHTRYDEQELMMWDEWYLGWRGDDYSREYDYVTHWMPLPEPPKEE